MGLAPFAPGTFGSAAAVSVFVLLSRLDPLLYCLTVAALCALGIWAADRAESLFGREDDRRIVIDEVIGQLIALAPLLWLGGRSSPLLIVTGFVAFRLFDIWKPGPVRFAERRFAGGVGVVMDDVVAGLLAATVVGALVLGGLAGAVPSAS